MKKFLLCVGTLMLLGGCDGAPDGTVRPMSADDAQAMYQACVPELIEKSSNPERQVAAFCACENWLRRADAARTDAALRDAQLDEELRKCVFWPHSLAGRAREHFVYLCKKDLRFYEFQNFVRSYIGADEYGDWENHSDDNDSEQYFKLWKKCVCEQTAAQPDIILSYTGVSWDEKAAVSCTEVLFQHLKK